MRASKAVRITIRPRSAVWLLLVLAPAIPELMTGSTSLNGLVLDPPLFAVQVALLLGLYGAGALLIREFCAIFQKGWASVLVLGAAYGVVEEGVAVHTFFQSSGNPVDAFATFGRYAGVNWLWALGLTLFHATYSIALPILLVYLVYPATRDQRWLDRGALMLALLAYASVVVILALTVPQGPAPALLALFLGLVAALVVLAWRLPRYALSLRRKVSRLGGRALVGAGMISFASWIVVTLLAAGRAVPAVVAAAVLVVGNLVALGLVLYGVGEDQLELDEFSFALGMVAILWGWDVLLIILGYWAAAVVIAGSAYLMVLLRRRVLARTSSPLRPLAHGASG